MTTPHVRRHFSTVGSALAATTLIVGAALPLGGCNDGHDFVAYCGDNDGFVVSETRCADDNSSDFIYVAPPNVFRRTIKLGNKLPKTGPAVDNTSPDVKKIPVNNATARTLAGLPPHGSFGKNGTRITLNGTEKPSKTMRVDVNTIQ